MQGPNRPPRVRLFRRRGRRPRRGGPACRRGRRRPDRHRRLQLVVTVAAGEHAHAQRAGAPRGQQVPDAVTHHEAVWDPPRAVAAAQEQVGVGLGSLDQVAGDDGRRPAGRAAPARSRPCRVRRWSRWPRGRRARSGGPGAPRRRAAGTTLSRRAQVGLPCSSVQRARSARRSRRSRAAGRRGTARRSCRSGGGCARRTARCRTRRARRLPGQDVLVDAVDERPVEVEQERRLREVRCSWPGRSWRRCAGGQAPATAVTPLMVPISANGPDRVGEAKFGDWPTRIWASTAPVAGSRAYSPRHPEVVDDPDRAAADHGRAFRRAR